MRRAHSLAQISVGLVGYLSLISCAGDSVAPPARSSNQRASGVPLAGAVSLRGPVAGIVSARIPAGAMSKEWPRSTGSMITASAASGGPAMRMLWQNTSTGDRSIWLMNGTSWDGSYVSLPQVPTAWSIAATGDFNADGYTDLVWQNTSTGDRSIWFMAFNNWNGAYALLPQVSPQWSIAGVGDFNGDGKPDLVWQNTTTGDRSIWFMNGSTWNGSYALLPQVTTAWQIAAVGDFNADGKPDLVWQNISTGERSIWLMNGASWDGSYASLPTVTTEWSIAAVFPPAVPPPPPTAIYVSQTDPQAIDNATCGLGPFGSGTGQFPCLTISRGLARAVAIGRTEVRVADGRYTEAVTLVSGKSLLGGYRPDTWERHAASTNTITDGVSSFGSDELTNIAIGVTSATIFEGFLVRGSLNSKP